MRGGREREREREKRVNGVEAEGDRTASERLMVALSLFLSLCSFSLRGSFSWRDADETHLCALKERTRERRQDVLLLLSKMRQA